MKRAKILQYSTRLENLTNQKITWNEFSWDFWLISPQADYYVGHTSKSNFLESLMPTLIFRFTCLYLPLWSLTNGFQHFGMRKTIYNSLQTAIHIWPNRLILKNWNFYDAIKVFHFWRLELIYSIQNFSAGPFKLLVWSNTMLCLFNEQYSSQRVKMSLFVTLLHENCVRFRTQIL